MPIRRPPFCRHGGQRGAAGPWASRPNLVRCPASRCRRRGVRRHAQGASPGPPWLRTGQYSTDQTLWQARAVRGALQVDDRVAALTAVADLVARRLVQRGGRAGERLYAVGGAKSLSSAATAAAVWRPWSVPSAAEPTVIDQERWMVRTGCDAGCGRLNGRNLITVVFAG